MPALLPATPPASLSQADLERMFPSLRPAGEEAGFALFTSGGLLLGLSEQPAAGDYRRAGLALYSRLLAAAGGRPLYRIWNYVPEINAVRSGMENYRAFSAGRALAFEEGYGADYRTRLPSASAVGCPGEALGAVFVAGRIVPAHFENPDQVPAYQYPPEHGPRPPSFARATAVEDGEAAYVFISGTASIKGHLTVAAGSLPAQLACTLDNLRLISGTAGSGRDLGESAGFQRHFKVYIRNEEDVDAVKGHLDQALFGPNDRVAFLRANLCRAALKVEIEATLVRPV